MAPDSEIVFGQAEPAVSLSHSGCLPSPEPAMTHFDTLAVHAGREDFARLGVHAPPIDLSTTYPVADLDAGTESFDALVGGAASAANPIYARLHNPTVGRVENALAQLEGTEACVAYGSGMAALTAVLLDARSRGGHVLVVRPLYGTSDHLLASGLCGLEAEFVDAAEIAARRRPDTALVIIETPANPTLDLVDIRAVVAAAGDVPVLVDSTFATPVLQQPASLGASYVMHSATKFLGGHGDVIEDAKARALLVAGVMTAARRVAGDGLGERQPCGQDRAACRSLCPLGHLCSDGQADAPRDSGFDLRGQDRLHIGWIMGETEIRGAGEVRTVEALRPCQSLRFNHLGQGRELAHRKSMTGRHWGVIGGMIDDGDHGLYLGPNAGEGKWAASHHDCSKALLPLDPSHANWPLPSVPLRQGLALRPSPRPVEPSCPHPLGYQRRARFGGRLDR